VGTVVGRKAEDALNLLASWTLTQNRPVDETDSIPRPAEASDEAGS
jgi:hypothetical protein